MVRSFICFYRFIMAPPPVHPDEMSWYQTQFGDWRCLICQGIACRAGLLNDQLKRDEANPLKDVDNKLWLQCDSVECLAKFHLECLGLRLDLPKGWWHCIRCRLQPFVDNDEELDSDADSN